MPETITLGHSPDPDDAFMFYALAEEKIDTRGYKFEHILQDIETLNQRATRGELHISAISIHAYAYVLDQYALLPCGASMGDGYGPLIVGRAGEEPGEDEDAIRAWLETRLIALPGAMTSAALAMRLFMKDFESVNVAFDRIFQLVQTGGAGAGVIIHEGQLTYASEGFSKIIDLGEWWKGRTGLPLPLGGNVIRKDIPPAVRKELSDILRESIRYGLENRAAGVRHSMSWARNLDTDLADRFIGMYVNELTMDYGERGRAAIQRFLGEASEAGLIPAPVELEFVE